ncbi:hypothetical protein BDP27DRAFT_1363871 [Rhodocollybia butyracea]|uniref:Uncharacterized protein n=1 Tax=Rhodocollybia butyracea TaxID=206335 RepID=A0A9P5U7A3_9AGAR|nr:hypothetical protein BDP27DRAFT_1363871 [Rhodocollybia butyracea]
MYSNFTQAFDKVVSTESQLFLSIFLPITDSVVMDLLTKRIALFDYISATLAAAISGSTAPADEELFESLELPVNGVVSDLDAALTWIFFASSFSNLEVQLYQCYHLWNASKRVMIFLLAFGIVASIGVRPEVRDIREENSLFFPIYVVCEVAVGLGLTILLASRIWWLNRQSERSLGKSSQSTLRKLTEIVIESGILLPVFLGVALGINVDMKFPGPDFIDLGTARGAQTLSICALTQAAAIASTLIIVRIGLGVDVQPFQFIESTHCPDMGNDSTQDSLDTLDLEQARIDMDNSGPGIINPFSLKYQDMPSGIVPPMPAN